MSGNSIGELFVVSTFGESHGPGIGCVIDGCPPGMELDCEVIQYDLDRRRPGSSRYTSQRREPDTVEILSGVFDGKTTGTPIGLFIKNVDHRSSDYAHLAETFRPGHADYTYLAKYGIHDHRGGGRSSARETCARVAAGAVAKKYLAEHYGIAIYGYLAQLGDIVLKMKDVDSIEKNPFFCPDLEQLPKLLEYIEKLRREGDSVGARVHITATGVSAGWGEPVFDRLDADIAHAMMGINAVKAVGIGAGFSCVAQRGSQHRDEMTRQGFASNNAGGVLGGISSGQNIEADVCFKPTSSIVKAGRTIDKAGNECPIVTKGRHDPCVGLRAVPIVEAMLALVLMDHSLRDRGQNFIARGDQSFPVSVPTSE